MLFRYMLLVRINYGGRRRGVNFGVSPHAGVGFEAFEAAADLKGLRLCRRPFSRSAGFVFAKVGVEDYCV